MAFFGESRRSQDMVDPPAEVSLKGIAKIIPIGVLNDVWMQSAKHVNETPGNRLFVSCSSIIWKSTSFTRFSG
jgi:hypothetical protein